MIVKIQNVHDYLHRLDQETFTKKDFDNVTPPFPYTWMEWKTKQNGLVGVSIGDITPFAKEFSRDIDHNSKWLCSGMVFLKLFTGQFFCLGRVTYPVGSDGQLESFPDGNDYQVETFEKPHFEPGEEDRLKYVDMMRALLFAPWMALSFMHCKNVTLEKSPPTPLALQKNRQRRGLSSLSRYHIIKIEPSSVKTKNTNPSNMGNAESGKSLHICRGHFKRYGPQWGTKLLFGKYEGRFWMPMHTRGSEEFGTVSKEYQVKP